MSEAPECGTYNGYKAHIRAGEATCEPCRAENNLAAKASRERVKAGRSTPPTTSERFWAKVDNAGECWNWTGAKKNEGYGAFWNGSRLTYAHRFSYELANGPIPTGQHIDHVCHNKSCVNPEHLRIATPKQNVENFSGLRSNNTSGVRGVIWESRRSHWLARVEHNGVIHYAGSFDDLDAAAEAVLAKRLELHTRNDKDRSAA